MIRLLKILFLNFFILFFLLFISEIILRVYFNIYQNYTVEMWKYASNLKKPTNNPKLPFVHKKNMKGNFYGVEIATNSLGLRDNEYRINKPENKKRILILGDSFTLGWGVPFPDLFSKKLEKHLNKKLNNIEVINTGVGNYNSIMELEFLKNYGTKFNPDLVILMFYINDVESTPKILSKFEYFFKKNFYIYSFIFDSYIKIKIKLDNDFQWDNYYSSLYNKNKQSYIENQNAIKNIISICKKNKYKLLIVNIPELRELKKYKFNFATKFISDIAIQNKIDFIDLRNFLVNHKPETLWVSKEDPHANSKANKIIANSIYEKIITNNLIKN